MGDGRIAVREDPERGVGGGLEQLAPDAADARVSQDSRRLQRVVAGDRYTPDPSSI